MNLFCTIFNVFCLTKKYFQLLISIPYCVVFEMFVKSSDRARQEGAATPAPPAVLLLTASAAKFPEACAAAGVPTPGHRFLDALVGRPNRVRGTFAAGHDWTQLLKKVIERL